MKKSPLFFYTVVLILVSFGAASSVRAQEEKTRAPDVYLVGVVESVGEGTTIFEYPYEAILPVDVRIDGSLVQAEFSDDPKTDADDLRAGERVVILKTEAFVGETRYIVTDRYRVPSLALLAVIFVLCAVLFAGKRGLTATIGLAFSFAVLLLFTVPFIVDGHDPFLIATISAFVIAIVSLTVAHGFNKQTRLALVSTLITLSLSLGLAQMFVFTAKLLGRGSDDALHLTFAGLSTIDLRGLLLAGIVIGVLGVLDDVTTSQTAAVKEIAQASQGLSFSSLFWKGLSVGREHIVSLVNTLALAYAGASLPLLLLFSTNEGQLPTWLILNLEIVSEEVVRTLIGSTALILAVPLSTLIAARSYARNQHPIL